MVLIQAQFIPKRPAAQSAHAGSVHLFLAMLPRPLRQLLGQQPLLVQAAMVGATPPQLGWNCVELQPKQKQLVHWSASTGDARSAAVIDFHALLMPRQTMGWHES